MQIITSKDNETVKNIKKLKDKKYRDEAGLYIIEGVKMIEEAIVANAKIDKIVVCEECLKTGDIEQKLLYEIAKYDCIYVNAKVFNFLTDVVAPSEIFWSKGKLIISFLSYLTFCSASTSSTFDFKVDISVSFPLTTNVIFLFANV